MAVPSNPATVYAKARVGSQGSFLAESVDSGASWRLVSVSLQWPAGFHLQNLAVGAGATLYAISSAYQCESDFFCTLVSWRPVRFDSISGNWMHVDAGLAGRVLKLLPSPSSSQVVVAETTEGLYVSDNAGEAWRLIRDRESHGSWDEVTLDRRDSRVFYVRHGRIVWTSEDLGSSWRASSPVEIGGEKLFLRSDPLDRGRAFLANTMGAVHETRDLGRSWAPVVLHDEILAETFVLTDVLADSQGDRVLLGGAYSSLFRLRLPDTGSAGLAIGSGLWGRHDQPGWGLSLTQHATGQVFGAWYTFSPEAEPIWRVIPGGTWLDPLTFQGTVYSTRASGFLGVPFDSRSVVMEASGQATLQFDGRNTGTLVFDSSDGTRIEQPIERLLFGPPEPLARADRGDLWWDPRESGWGIAIAQQYEKLFATWFIYDDAGRPTWLALPNGVWTSSTAGSTYAGAVYRARGTSPGVPYEASAFAVESVGTASITFHAEGDAWLKYDVSGRTGARLIRRQPF